MEKLVIQKEKAEGEHKIVQEGVVGADDDADLPARNQEEADDPEFSRQEHHPDQRQFHDQRSQGGEPVETMWEMLKEPADPGGKGAVLVILIHCAQRSPLGIAAEQLYQA